MRSLAPSHGKTRLGVVGLAAAATWPLLAAEAEGWQGAVSGGFGVLLRELLSTQLHELAWAALRWTLLGLVIGGLGAVLAIWGFAKLGWWKSGWRFERWVRWMACLFMLGSGLFCGAAAGFWKGVGDGGEIVLRKSQLATEVFPLAAGALADGLASIQVSLISSNLPTGVTLDREKTLAAFRDGTWEFDAARFSEQLDQMRLGVVSNALVKIETEVVANMPMLGEGVNRALLQAALGYLGTALVEEKLGSELHRLGVARLHTAIRDRLPEVAALAGKAETIARADLAAFLVQEAVVPLLIVPLKSFVTANILLAIGLGLLALLLPPLFFRFTCGRVKPS